MRVRPLVLGLVLLGGLGGHVSQAPQEVHLVVHSQGSQVKVALGGPQAAQKVRLVLKHPQRPQKVGVAPAKGPQEMLTARLFERPQKVLVIAGRSEGPQKVAGGSQGPQEVRRGRSERSQKVSGFAGCAERSQKVSRLSGCPEGPEEVAGLARGPEGS